VIHSTADWDEFGSGLVTAGDIDGDGYDDIWAGVNGAFAVLVRGGPRY
jgi:hypothetical protein